jgi:hypothetical protein
VIDNSVVLSNYDQSLVRPEVQAVADLLLAIELRGDENASVRRLPA